VIAARTRLKQQLARYNLLKSGPKEGNLGWGGNGVALWFHTRPEPTRRRREFVAKANHAVGGEETIQDEIKTMGVSFGHRASCRVSYQQLTQTTTDILQCNAHRAGVDPSSRKNTAVPTI
jgi:hypothetical protein